MRKRLCRGHLYQETGDAGLVCRRCGISYPTLQKWMHRYREAGEAGLVSRSRCPTRSPNRRIFEHERDLILSLRRERKLGARRIQHEPRRHHDLSLSLDSIHKVLVPSHMPPLVRPARRKTRHRYARLIPGDRVQLDTCKSAPGCYQYTAVDDCTRYRVLAVFPRRTAASTLVFQQDAEKVRQRRSRIAQRLTVRQEYDSPHRSLRPCWTAFVRILRAILIPTRHMN